MIPKPPDFTEITPDQPQALQITMRLAWHSGVLCQWWQDIHHPQRGEWIAVPAFAAPLDIRPMTTSKAPEPPQP